MIGIVGTIALMLSRAMLRYVAVRRTLAVATTLMAFTVFCPGDLSAGSGPEREITLYRLGTPIKFGDGESSGYYKKSGWGEAGDGYTWTEGSRSSLHLPLATMDMPTGVTIKAKLKPFLIPKYVESQLIEVYVNGGQVARWVAKGSKVRDFEIRIPGRTLKKRPVVELEFRIPEAVSSLDFAAGSDDKAHGAAFYEVIIY